MLMIQRYALLLGLCWLGPYFSPLAFGEVTYPDRPADRGFISDAADLLTADQETAIRKQLDAVLTSKAIPILIVTVDALSEFGAEGMSIETYARMLYDHWSIGHESIRVKGAGWGREAEQHWNKGVLLLVSVGDHKARIELGAGFGHSKDATCDRIMQSNIIPYFKQGDFPGGILAGIKALEQMARGEIIRAPPRPVSHTIAIVLFALLVIASFWSMVQRGASGWGWALWALVFSILGWFLWSILTSRGKSSGGFSGGSFGGGYSGGGGSTGSW